MLSYSSILKIMFFFSKIITSIRFISTSISTHPFLSNKTYLSQQLSSLKPIPFLQYHPSFLLISSFPLTPPQSSQPLTLTTQDFLYTN